MKVYVVWSVTDLCSDVRVFTSIEKAKNCIMKAAEKYCDPELWGSLEELKEELDENNIIFDFYRIDEVEIDDDTPITY